MPEQLERAPEYTGNRIKGYAIVRRGLLMATESPLGLSVDVYLNEDAAKLAASSSPGMVVVRVTIA